MGWSLPGPSVERRMTFAHGRACVLVEANTVEMRSARGSATVLTRAGVLGSTSRTGRHQKFAAMRLSSPCACHFLHVGADVSQVAI